MNDKKAKKLRALVRHLQATNATESKEWRAYGVRDRTISKQVRNEAGELVDTRVPDGTIWLMPACGRAIYQGMKRTAARKRLA